MVAKQIKSVTTYIKFYFIELSRYTANDHEIHEIGLKHRKESNNIMILYNSCFVF